MPADRSERGGAGALAAAIAEASRRRGDARAHPRVVACDQAADSFVQSRGVMFFSFAYFFADSSIIYRIIALSGAYQSLTTFHCVPSHVWNFARPEPS
jgi:hypothetical protein